MLVVCHSMRIVIPTMLHTIVAISIGAVLSIKTMGFATIAPYCTIGWPRAFVCQSHAIKFSLRLFGKYGDVGREDVDDDDDDDDEDVALSDKDDWRSFRAKLVMGEKPPIGKTAPSATTFSDDDLDGIGALFADQSSQGSSSLATGSTALYNKMTPLDPSQWAYDTGKVIEKGAVILGGVEQTYGFGLRQQYFHKAAILIVDHDEKTFTRAIILNRPTDLMLDDETNPGVKWRVWYGGDVEGMETRKPSIICTWANNACVLVSQALACSYALIVPCLVVNPHPHSFLTH